MFIKLILALSITNPVANFAALKNLSEDMLTKATQNLEDIISEQNFGLIKDPSVGIINNKLESQYNIDTEQVELTNLNYSGVRVKAKENSKDYSGSKFIKFESQLSYTFTGFTKRISAEAYNSTQEVKDILSISYSPSFGEMAFTDYFKTINFQWRGITWDNGLSGAGGDRYHTKNNRGGSENPLTAVQDSFEITDKSMAQTQIYSRQYSKTNWMKSYGYFGFFWKEEIISLNFTVEASCYATAWNAYWAKVANQLEIKNLNFSK
ncbi:hypothetical protein [Spiroplasma alleghenense]|uniref:Uncharacterized protein n=1 Tax=Spiroplasma alleghenense TaxID=216931 RepID=A0A345Z547_9MOLU|nr:hypothetical protein [Spiroplasma alleghenense]AXK51726.1 hypothetical protein SALLE_v1c10560 [Spiroplasma alleghenense]